MSTGKPTVSVSIEPLPSWIDAERLLGGVPRLEARADGRFRALCEMSPPDAAALAARLRGLGLDGHPLEVRCTPPLSRALVRAGRLAEARARRDTSPGFTRSLARATGEGRYSLTPERLALALGRKAEAGSVVDACAGSGGNCIGFARAGARVTALEISPERLAEARHNARVYQVLERIDFRLADARTLVSSLRADLLFIDPPWGEAYDKRRTTVDDMPLLAALLAQDLSGFREVWLKVPSSFSTESAPDFRPAAWFGHAPGDFRRIKFLLLTRAQHAVVARAEGS